jgi:L,D-transpeptidase YnhG
MLLPDTPREGIVVNLAELRLYYFPPGKTSFRFIRWALVSWGWKRRDDHARGKIPNPTWTPTPGIRARSLEQGIKLPPVVLPGRITRWDACAAFRRG